MKHVRAAACVISCALLFGFSGHKSTIDRDALAARIDATTDFDAEQSACVADEVFRLFGDATIKTLYEEGVGPLRYSFEGQTYAAVVISCVTR